MKKLKGKRSKRITNTQMEAGSWTFNPVLKTCNLLILRFRLLHLCAFGGTIWHNRNIPETISADRSIKVHSLCSGNDNKRL